MDYLDARNSVALYSQIASGLAGAMLVFVSILWSNLDKFTDRDNTRDISSVFMLMGALLWSALSAAFLDAQALGSAPTLKTHVADPLYWDRFYATFTLASIIFAIAIALLMVAFSHLARLHGAAPEALRFAQALIRIAVVVATLQIIPILDFALKVKLRPVPSALGASHALLLWCCCLTGLGLTTLLRWLVSRYQQWGQASGQRTMQLLAWVSLSIAALATATTAGLQQYALGDLPIPFYQGACYLYAALWGCLVVLCIASGPVAPPPQSGAIRPV